MRASIFEIFEYITWGWHDLPLFFIKRLGENLCFTFGPHCDYFVGPHSDIKDDWYLFNIFFTNYQITDNDFDELVDALGQGASIITLYADFQVNEVLFRFGGCEGEYFQFNIRFFEVFCIQTNTWYDQAEANGLPENFYDID